MQHKSIEDTEMLRRHHMRRRANGSHDPVIYTVVDLLQFAAWFRNMAYGAYLIQMYRRRIEIFYRRMCVPLIIAAVGANPNHALLELVCNVYIPLSGQPNYIDTTDCCFTKRRTALHIACKKADMESVRILLRNGAALNITDNNGHTPYNLIFDKSRPITTGTVEMRL